MAWLILGFAICAEIVATSLLRATDGFSRPLPSVLVLGLYGASFVCLAHAIKVIPVGVAYAVWAGIGTAAIAVIGALWLGDPMSALGALGIGLIAVGVVVLNVSGVHS